jgi:hypothetical protein
MKKDRAKHEAESFAERIEALKIAIEVLGANANNGEAYYSDSRLKLRYSHGFTSGSGEHWRLSDVPSLGKVPSFTVDYNPYILSGSPKINFNVEIKDEGDSSSRGSKFGIWRFYEHGGFDKIMEVPVEDITVNDALVSTISNGKILIIDKTAVDPQHLPSNLTVIEGGVKRLSDRVEKYRQTHS